MVTFPQVSPPKPCMHLSCLGYMPHVPPISLLILSLNSIWWEVQIIKLLITHSSPFPLLHPCYAQISFTEAKWNALSPCSSFSMIDNVFWGTIRKNLSLEFYIDIILPIVLWPWGWLSLQQKWVPGFPGGKCGRCVRLTLPPACAVVMKSGNLNLLEPSGPLQAYNGTALLYV